PCLAPVRRTVSRRWLPPVAGGSSTTAGTTPRFTSVDASAPTRRSTVPLSCQKTTRRRSSLPAVVFVSIDSVSSRSRWANEPGGARDPSDGVRLHTGGDGRRPAAERILAQHQGAHGRELRVVR